MSPQHVDPEEAVKIHMEVRSNKTFAVHWGTFALANEVFLLIKKKIILNYKFQVLYGAKTEIK